MSGDSPSVRRRRGHRARLRRVVPVAVALSLPLAAVSSEAAPAGPAPAPAASAPQPLAWMTPAGVAAVLDLRSLDDFAEIARKPPAAPPIRKLPKVRLATVSAGTIPAVAAAAYLAAARGVARTDPACGLHWWVVAGIGFVESGHAASGGSGSRHWDGVARPPILGPVLDGSGGFAAIRDSDGGRYDGNATWDRAVGPMQFLPSTWRAWGTGPDGRPGNPQAIVPAAAATARYLCAGAEDLGTPAGLARAVFSYNHSFDYVRLVLSVAARYAGLSAADLGVDALPTDAEFRRHLRHRESDGDRRTRDSTGTSGSDTGGSDPSPAPEPATSTSPTPSPSPTSDSGGPLPQPSPSATLLPLPTTTGLLLQLP